MKKPLLTYLLSLCIFLIGGLGSVYAGAQSSAYSSYRGAECINLDVVHYPAFILQSSWHGPEKHFQIDIVENKVEEEESFSSKKNPESCTSSVLSTRIPAYFFSLSKGNFAFNKACSHTSSCRYLIFEVFRI